MMKKGDKKVEIKDYYECSRCGINSETNRFCPCPRGSCEAKKGKIKVTREILKLDE